MKKTLVLMILLLLISSFYSGIENNAQAQTKKLEYKVLAQYHHDSNAFTQGLEIHQGKLYEGTGLYGRSSLRKVNLNSGEILKKIMLDDQYFGEGITIIKDKIYQLSWKENTAFVYDLNFNLINEFHYQGEGWGLANNGYQLIMSNGSQYIFFRDPDSFNIIRRIKVVSNGKEIKNINELEYLNGYIYANVWQTNFIIKIDAKNGNVDGVLDLKNIVPKAPETEIDVLNGIAYDPEKDNFLITGKLWPKIFRIKIIK